MKVMTKILGNTLVRMTAKDEHVVSDENGDMVYTFAVSHWFKEALEHGFTLAEAVEEFDRQIS